jgi:acetylornithine deacetylase/succinyl-diaminopimelate desuccinylase-like protein
MEGDVSRFVLSGGLVLVLAVGLVRAQGGSPSPGDLLKDPAVKAAVDAAKATEAQTIADQIRFCEIPAPSFKEEARGVELKRVFTQLGLRNVRVDKVGNVLGEYPGAAAAHPHLVLAAHLDTVFPEGTNVKVTREGNLLKGPGIGDDCRGLAVMVAIIREMRKADVKTPGAVTFVANVGEEGLGDLRGVKELFNTTLKGQIDRFVSIDGTGVHVTNVAVGSHRYRVTFKGPGGHSFGAFGMANPMGAMGRAIAKIQELQVPKQPRTTFNVGRIGGGHVGQFDPVRGMDGTRHAIVGSGGARRGGREHHESDRRGGRRGERALGQARHHHRREGTGGRSSGGIDT